MQVQPERQLLLPLSERFALPPMCEALEFRPGALKKRFETLRRPDGGRLCGFLDFLAERPWLTAVSLR